MDIVTAPNLQLFMVFFLLYYFQRDNSLKSFNIPLTFLTLSIPNGDECLERFAKRQLYLIYINNIYLEL